jgi:DNA-binding NarL/FixJ family response regulator
MSDYPLKLLLIDQDPIFRLGLKTCLEQFSNLEVVSEAETETIALQILAEFAQNDPFCINMVVLELGGRSSSSLQLGLQLCQQLKNQYPNLPILLLSSIQDQGLLKLAKALGINGYCPKGTPPVELVAAMQQIAEGDSYWFEEDTRQTQLPVKSTPFAKLIQNLRLSGNAQINSNLGKVTKQLQTPGVPILQKVVLAGNRRELLAARWLLNKLLIPSAELQIETTITPALSPISSSTANYPSLLSPRALQSILFSLCVNKLQYPLENVSDSPLEVDILQLEKKRELLYLILQKIAHSLDEVRSSRIESNQLLEIKNNILLDLWQATTIEFFGKFSRVQLGNNTVELVNTLLQNTEIVKSEILDKIPLVSELFSYLLYQIDLQIDNLSYPAGSEQANEQALMLLENLLIQVANGVLQPLLDQLADVETIKQKYYDSRLISTREIERFRNNLSWKYRWRNYVTEAKAIFESRYELFVIAPRGIAKTSIYAPRRQELVQLSGIPLFVTLVLEFRDAIAPRLQALLSLIGSGIVFVLTQIVGRGLGLIGRGILQGIGSVSISQKKEK